MRKTVLSMFMALCILACFNLAQAQDKNEGIARVVHITPVDGKGSELVEAVTQYHHWMGGNEGHMKYQWYEIITGSDTGTYIARTSGHNWADFDAKYDWQEAANKKFQADVAPLVADIQIEMTRDMDDVSHWPESLAGYTHFVVENWHIKNGSYGAFMKGLKTIHDTMVAAEFDAFWGFMAVASGGHGNQVTFVGPQKGWADMSAPETSFASIMTKSLGSEEAFENFMSDWSATFKVGENHMVKLLPEASNYGD